jgi:hypothetical protein
MEKNMETRKEEILVNELNHLRPYPSTNYFQHMQRAPWTPRGIARRRVVPIAILMLLAAICFIALTPPGKTLAQQLLHLFKTTDSTSFPIDPTDEARMANYHIPTPVPTHIPSIQMVNSSVYDEPSPFLLPLEEALSSSGYPPRVLPFSDPPVDFVIQRVSYEAETRMLFISYFNPDGVFITLLQGAGDFPEIGDYILVPEDVIQRVEVNGYPGEYVEGGFDITVVNGVASKNAGWDNTAPIAHLRWREGDRWFFVDRVYSPTASAKMERDAVIALAESMVTFGTGNEAPGKIDAILPMVEYQYGLPQELPQGFLFRYAQYDASLKNMLLVYSSGTDILSIMEKPTSDQAPGETVYSTYSFNGPKSG